MGACKIGYLKKSEIRITLTGWLWGVQVVTGDSQEEVIFFRDRQTHRTFLLYIDMFGKKIVTEIMIVTWQEKTDVGQYCKILVMFLKKA